jgi:hypothetical protein
MKRKILKPPLLVMDGEEDRSLDRLLWLCWLVVVKCEEEDPLFVAASGGGCRRRSSNRLYIWLCVDCFVLFCFVLVCIGMY